MSFIINKVNIWNLFSRFMLGINLQTYNRKQKTWKRKQTRDQSSYKWHTLLTSTQGCYFKLGSNTADVFNTEDVAACL